MGRGTWSRAARASPIVMLVALVVACGTPAAAPVQPPRMAVVGFVASGSRQPWHEGFRQGLREAGYVEGENVQTEFRYADGQQEDLPKLIDQLLQLKIDVI